MAYVLGKRSRKNLEGVHPNLVKVVERAIQISKQDFMVIEGVRTRKRQAWLYAQGRTRPGRKVTWTLTNSRHFVNSRTGYGHAVDLCPWPVDWSDLKKFTLIYEAMFQAAKELNVPLRWGADWNRNGRIRERKESDNPHFELA